MVHTFPKFTILKSIHLWFFCLKTTCTIKAWSKTNHLHLKNFQFRQYHFKNSGHCGRNQIHTFPVQGHCHIPWQCHKSANLGIKKKYSCSSWPSQLNYPFKQHATEWQLHMLTISTVNGLNLEVTCNTVVRVKELTLMMMMMMLKLLLPLPTTVALYNCHLLHSHSTHNYAISKSTSTALCINYNDFLINKGCQF